MSEISELEERLVSAMARIKAALETRASEGGGDSAALEAKISVLEAEREAARVAAEATQEALDSTKAQLAASDAATAELRATVEELQSANADLRLAASEGLTDANAINKALAADLAALQMARATDLRDVEALLSQIAPAEEAPHA
ncbi:MAG: hypothetical protein AAGA38_01035 [Pseudomonadota bacterium]